MSTVTLYDKLGPQKVKSSADINAKQTWHESRASLLSQLCIAELTEIKQKLLLEN